MSGPTSNRSLPIFLREVFVVVVAEPEFLNVGVRVDRLLLGTVAHILQGVVPCPRESRPDEATTVRVPSLKLRHDLWPLDVFVNPHEVNLNSLRRFTT